VLQDRLVRLLGSTVEGRAALVTGMLHRGASEAMSYWLQLGVSVGIATLGLVVGSSAVVIGAMLVAPLMGPIIGLAMGLASGSPFLVLRSGGRIALSVIVAISGATLITVLLPFHELNAEISARTSPTVLDLITAAFCALAGVYASLRPGPDTAATAAGTSIGISLVPPLCASGYGVGTAAWSVAGGAALLFLTNLVAIVVVGTVAFVAAGFNRVATVALEHDELSQPHEGAPIARALARRLSRLFASRWGPALRFLMPFVLLAAVYVPLRRALDEVAWEVRVRASIREALANEPSRVVQSRVRVERRQVDLVLVILGDTKDADRARSRLNRQIGEASGTTPRLEIYAVPDAAALAGVESTLMKPQLVSASSPAPPSSELQLGEVQSRLHGLVQRMWPSGSIGDPLRVELGLMQLEPLVIRVTHFGAPLSRDGAETLERALEAELDRKIRIEATHIPAFELTRTPGDLAFVGQLASALEASSNIAAINVCVRRPEPAAEPDPAEVALAGAVAALLRDRPRVTTSADNQWSVRFTKDPCTEAPGASPAVQPGAPAASGEGGAEPAPSE
jgi:uncharacterized hydrophobic protein (TIGR00271 family)